MAVALRSVGVSPGSSTTSCVIGKPVGLAVGDLMIAQVGYENSTGTITGVSAPANWTEIRTDLRLDVHVSALFWKIADSDDTSATNFTFTASLSGSPGVDGNVGAITAWETETFNASAPINTSSGQANASSVTITAPTITPSVADCMLLMICAVSSNTTQSNYAITDDNPSSWSEAYDLAEDLANDTAIAMGYAIRPETSATGNGTATCSTARTNLGQLVAIAPPSAAPPIKPYTPHCGPRRKRTQFMPSLRMGL